MIVEDDIIGPHAEEESKETNEDQDDVKDVLALFDIEPKKDEAETGPPIEQSKTTEKKGITVKFNKEETFIEDEKVPELARKGLNYDKVEGRAKELQATLDRAAKIAGFKDHTEYVANLDQLEQQQQQKQQTELDDLRNDMLDQLEANGLDREKAEQWMNSHPLIKQGEEALAERKKATQQADEVSKWQPLYKEYPELAEAVQKAGEKPVEWYTPEMQALVAKGNDPLLAYEHLNKDKIRQQTKKTTEQRLIKEQQLGIRSRVETNAAPDNETAVPADLANAFAAFDLPADLARKYMKK